MQTLWSCCYCMKECRGNPVKDFEENEFCTKECRAEFRRNVWEENKTASE